MSCSQNIFVFFFSFSASCALRLGNVDCSALVKPLDISPNRSPQVVHSFLADYVRGKDVVEIGTHKGDGINCFGQFAKSAVAIEADEEDCKNLKARGSHYDVLCGFFPSLIHDGDIFTLWQESPHLLYGHVAQDLLKAQKKGLIRQSAEAVYLFEKGYESDMQWHEVFSKIASWEKEIEYDEREASQGHERAHGSFILLGIKVSNFEGVEV